MRVIKGLVQDYGEEDKLVSSQSKRYSLRSTQARQLLGLKAEHAKRIKQNLGILFTIPIYPFMLNNKMNYLF